MSKLDTTVNHANTKSKRNWPYWTLSSLGTCFLYATTNYQNWTLKQRERYAGKKPTPFKATLIPVLWSHHQANWTLTTNWTLSSLGMNFPYATTNYRNWTPKQRERYTPIEQQVLAEQAREPAKELTP